jgi:hypothetical protein
MADKELDQEFWPGRPGKERDEHLLRVVTEIYQPVGKDSPDLFQPDLTEDEPPQQEYNAYNRLGRAAVSRLTDVVDTIADKTVDVGTGLAKRLARHVFRVDTTDL